MRCIIIAEAGVNHNGDINLAKKMIDVAKEAKVDFVKFQAYYAYDSVSVKAEKAFYQKENQKRIIDEKAVEMSKRLELNFSQLKELKDYCNEKNVAFMASAFDIRSANDLKNLGERIGKIPSGEITNLPYLQKMAEAFPEIILSTGMADIKEIKAALTVLQKSGTKKENITILHCNTEYPTPMEDVNLKAMNYIGRELDIAVGYSDHTLGIEVPIAAVTLGATVIEKHFTLDRNMEGPDHSASLEPGELKAMVAAIRNIEKAIAGSGIKEPSLSELKNKAIARKSIHLSKDLAAGHVLTGNELVMKRPGTGISPMEMAAVVGKKLVKDLSADQMLSLEDLEKE